jgi:hypothetical protein
MTEQSEGWPQRLLAVREIRRQASIVVQENYLLLRGQKELEKENRALRDLYQDLKTETSQVSEASQTRNK